MIFNEQIGRSSVRPWCGTAINEASTFKKTVDVKKKGHHKRIRNEVADDLGDYEHISQALKHCHDISTCKLDVPIESVEVIRSVWPPERYSDRYDPLSVTQTGLDHIRFIRKVVE